MMDSTLTCKVLVYSDKGDPLVTQELERNRLEINHGHIRTVIQLPKYTSVYVFSGEARDDMDYGEPIKTSLGRTVASIRRASTESNVGSDDDIIIVRHRGINYYILIPQGTFFQVHEETIETAA